jgi:hypothetical protein
LPIVSICDATMLSQMLWQTSCIIQQLLLPSHLMTLLDQRLQTGFSLAFKR